MSRLYTPAARRGCPLPAGARRSLEPPPGVPSDRVDSPGGPDRLVPRESRVGDPMSDPQGARWRAIAAGMLLLAGTGILNGARMVAAKSLASGSAGPSEQVRVAAAIRARLPQVDEPLSERIAASVVRCQREQSLAPD